MATPSQKSISAAASLVRDWAEHWYSDDCIGDTDRELDQDRDAQRLVLKVHALLAEQETPLPPRR